MQVLWVYEHPIDLDGLKRFHHDFGRGMLARRIEPSLLPFGRHRWVSAGPPPELAISDTPGTGPNSTTGLTNRSSYRWIRNGGPAGGSGSNPSPTARPSSAWSSRTASPTVGRSSSVWCRRSWVCTATWDIQRRGR